jgi:ATP-dependent Clp protease ATP-binding subunit ClpA
MSQGSHRKNLDLAPIDARMGEFLPVVLPRPGYDMLSPDLEKTLYRAIHLAEGYQHEYATLEHLLLALTEDPTALAIFQTCDADLERLRNDLTNYLATELEDIKSERALDAKPTAGFQRSLQRAAIRVQVDGKDHVLGADLLIAMLSEGQSHAVYFLHQQEGLHDKLATLANEPRK